MSRRSPRLSRLATAADASAVNTTMQVDDSETDDEMPNLGDISTSENESTDSSSDDTDDEDCLHGPCGGKVCGADPPAPSERTYLGQYVAKEFQVAGQEHTSLFWDKVVAYFPRTSKFSVSRYFLYFVFVSTLPKQWHAGQIL